MTMIEFSLLCQQVSVLAPAWKELSESCLSLRILRSEMALCTLRGDPIDPERRGAVAQLTSQTQAHQHALAEECKKLDIEVPTYNNEDVCNIYTWGT